MLGPPQLALSVVFRFESLCVGALHQLALSVAFRFESLCVGALHQLALSVVFRFESLCVGAPPQLALSVVFRFESLCVGAPLQLALSVAFCFESLYNGFSWLMLNMHDLNLSLLYSVFFFYDVAVVEVLDGDVVSLYVSFDSFCGNNA